MKHITSISQRPVFSIAMIGALVVLLPLLAVLQYRWIGQVSQAERTRLARNLDANSFGAQRNINDELEQIVDEFNVSQRPSGSRDLNDELVAYFETEITEDYENWQARAPNSALLRNLYLYNISERSYRRFDPETATLVEGSVPISRFERWFDSPFGIPERLANDDLFPNGELWMVSEVIIANGRRQRSMPLAPPAQNLLLFEVDPSVFWNEVVPGVMQTRFDQTDYRVAIEDSRTGRLFYASDSSVTGDIVAEADARQPLASRQRPFRVIGPDLQIVAQHELGSLAEAVDAARRRNLGVGFGILTLLGATGAMIIVWSERVRSVGRLQMEFAAGISHELRTPLATIRTAAHNIASGVITSPEEIREYAEIVQSEGRRLSAMVDQAIQFAQTEAGRRHYDLVAVDVDDVVTRAVQTALPSAREGGNRIEIHRHPEVPQALADETALTHCLVNLLTNAIKFGQPDKPVTIDVSHDPGRSQILMSVHNEGPGIDVDELGNLFEPFYRGHDTSHVPGSGLGLSLVRRMMEGQKGDVSVESKPDQGATFTLRIPADDSDTRSPENATA